MAAPSTLPACPTTVQMCLAAGARGAGTLAHWHSGRLADWQTGRVADWPTGTVELGTPSQGTTLHAWLVEKAHLHAP